MPGDVIATEAASGVAEIVTPHAGRYLQQLCKHFQHKLQVTFNAAAGSIEFVSGVCTLAAGNGVLRLSVMVRDASQLAQLQDVVARHLVRFAFREEILVEWREK
jgi:uncharacterized protein